MVPQIIKVASVICANRQLKSKMANARAVWNKSTSFLCALQEKIRLIRLGTCLTHTHAGKSQDELDRPIQYSKSNAATWKAQDTRSGGYYDDYPSFQPYVVSGSLAVLLLYFCVLREENDIDEELGKSLYDRIPGLEKTQLEAALRYNAMNGQDTSAVTARLQELQEK